MTRRYCVCGWVLCHSTQKTRQNDRCSFLNNWGLTAMNGRSAAAPHPWWLVSCLGRVAWNRHVPLLPIASLSNMNIFIFFKTDPQRRCWYTLLLYLQFFFFFQTHCYMFATNLPTWMAGRVFLSSCCTLFSSPFLLLLHASCFMLLLTTFIYYWT
jgi:hypothetical protein